MVVVDKQGDIISDTTTTEIISPGSLHQHHYTILKCPAGVANSRF